MVEKSCCSSFSGLLVFRFRRLLWEFFLAAGTNNWNLDWKITGQDQTFIITNFYQLNITKVEWLKNVCEGVVGKSFEVIVPQNASISLLNTDFPFCIIFIHIYQKVFMQMLNIAKLIVKWLDWPLKILTVYVAHETRKACVGEFLTVVVLIPICCGLVITCAWRLYLCVKQNMKFESD